MSEKKNTDFFSFFNQEANPTLGIAAGMRVGKSQSSMLLLHQAVAEDLYRLWSLEATSLFLEDVDYSFLQESPEVFPYTIYKNHRPIPAWMKKERPGWMTRLENSKYPSSRLLMSSDTWKSMVEWSNSEDYDKRDAALRNLRAMPDIPEDIPSMLACSELPIKPDETVFREGVTVEPKTLTEPSEIEITEDKSYKSPENLVGVPWTLDIGINWAGRVALGQQHDNGKVYSLDFEIGEVFYDNQNQPEIDLLAAGYLKWDGCMNVSFYDTAHFCDPKMLQEFTKAIEWVWTQGPLMETWF